MLVCVSSVRGAPGVSSWALLVAAAWNHRSDRVLVEADGTGGILSARYDVPPRPGVVELVSALRRSQVDSGLQLENVGRLLRHPEPQGNGGGLWAVPAPIAGHEVLLAWSELAQPVAKAMVDDDRLWVADCGRVWAGSPFELLLTMADLNIVLSDSSVPALVVLRSRVRAIPGTRAVIVVGPVKHAPEDLLGFTGADLLWNVPYYPSLAERSGQLATDGKRGRRSKEWKMALTITDAIARHLDQAPADPGSPAAPGPPAAADPPANIGPPAVPGPPAAPGPPASPGSPAKPGPPVNPDTPANPGPPAGAPARPSPPAGAGSPDITPAAGA